MNPKKRTYTSLLISEEKIQLLRIDKKKLAVTSLAEAKLNTGLVNSGEVVNQEQLAQAIISLFQSAKLTDRFVVVGIPENKSYTKVLRLPKLKATELTEAVSWEAETYLPVAIDQVYMDWKLIEDPEKDDLNILLIAVPKDIIDGYTNALTLAGLIPIAYETTSLSLVRLVEDQNIRALIVDIRQRHAVLTLAKGKAIQASSIVAITSQDQSKETKNLIQTINKMLTFYEGKQDSIEKVKTIFISGEGLTQALLTEIANETKREVKPCPIKVKNLPQNQLLNFAVVSSLAMKEIASPDDEETINLLPPNIQDKFDQTQKKKTSNFWLTITIIIVALSAAASIATFLYFHSLQASLLSQQTSIPPPPLETGEAVKQTNSINRAAKTIIDVSQKRIFPQQRLTDIIPKVPSEIKVISIRIDEINGKLRIVGRAQKRGDLLKFRDDIETLEKVEQAILPLSSLQQAENIDFVLTASLK